MFPPLAGGAFRIFAFPAAEKVSDLPQPTDYVSDFAHVLSPEAIARLDAICRQLDHSAANAQIAVVTVHDLDGDDAADYANQLEDHWKMGDKDKAKGQNRYAMVFLAVDDHKYRIEVGYGLEGILPDGKVGDIGRDMVPDLRANDYDGAMTRRWANSPGDRRRRPHHAQRRACRASEQPRTASLRIGNDPSIIVILSSSWCSLLRMLFGLGLFFGGWGSGRLWRRRLWRRLGGGFGGGGGGGGFRRLWRRRRRFRRRRRRRKLVVEL